jgi:hypothetical protein
MLKKIVSIVNTSNPKVGVSTLCCKYTIDDITFYQTLVDNNIIENLTTETPKVGDELVLEFSLLKLKTLGFYNTIDLFISNNRYEIPSEEIYINESKQYLTKTIFYLNYTAIVNLINELQNNAKHNYDDVEINNVIFVREEKSLFMKLDYNGSIFTTINRYVYEDINSFIEILKDNNFQDKKNIYLNELIEFCLKFDEEIRFESLLYHFNTFKDNSFSTYNFYLRNFSYNKLKLEIDSKAIEFNQKLQAVINDSQTKLIAIPTAFILVLSSLDYEKINSPKNFIAVGGLFIFSTLLQLFINNQKSSIKFIQENIDYYKSTFKNQDRKNVEQSFCNVKSEKNKQFERLILIEVLLWFVPIFTLCMILFFLSFELAAILLMFFYLWISSHKLFLKY